MIPSSEIDAQNIVENLCPTLNLRAIYVSIISDGIIEANRYNRKLWAINMSNDAVRLTVAHYYVCTVESHKVV